jgi:hypothetical protein
VREGTKDVSQWILCKKRGQRRESVANVNEGTKDVSQWERRRFLRVRELEPVLMGSLPPSHHRLTHNPISLPTRQDYPANDSRQ